MNFFFFIYHCKAPALCANPRNKYGALSDYNVLTSFFWTILWCTTVKHGHQVQNQMIIQVHFVQTSKMIKCSGCKIIYTTKRIEGMNVSKRKKRLEVRFTFFSGGGCNTVRVRKRFLIKSHILGMGIKSALLLKSSINDIYMWPISIHTHALPLLITTYTSICVV